MLPCQPAFYEVRKLSFDPKPSGLSIQDQSALLQRLAPVFITANKTDFPVVAPTDFARNSRVVLIGKIPFDVPGDIPPAPRFESEDTVGQILEFVANGNDTTYLALRLRASFLGQGWFNGDGKRNEDFNRQSMTEGRGVLGAVRGLGENKLLVQYFLLLTHNTTADAPYGDHEGDWICIDFIVERSNLEHPVVSQAIFHNHGRQLRIEPQVLKYDSGHPLVWLEEGSNEPWPVRGTRGFSGYPPSGLTVNKMWPDGEDYGSEHKVVCHHRGEGFAYYTEGAVIDVQNDPGEDARLVRVFKGTWGGHWKNFDPDDDVFPGLGFFFGGYSTESPRSPLYQDKMWERKYDQSWLSPPWTGDGVQESSLERTRSDSRASTALMALCHNERKVMNKKTIGSAFALVVFTVVVTVLATRTGSSPALAQTHETTKSRIAGCRQWRDASRGDR